MRVNAGKLIGLSAVFLTMLLTTGCADRPTVINNACVSFDPIYLSEGAISALRPFRADREKIAAHNRTWESQCSK